MNNIQFQIAEFVSQREWQKFHTIKNLCMAISVEAGELMEIVEWRSDEELKAPLPAKLASIRDEIADIMICCLSLCNVTGIDPDEAMKDKLQKDELKYPAEVYRGRPPRL